MHKKDMHGEAAAGSQNPSSNMVCKAALVGRQHPNHKSEDLEVHTKLLEDARKSSAPANNHGWSIQWSFKCFNLSKTLQWCSQARADQLWDFHQALAGNFFPRWRTNSHSLWLSELYDSTFLVSERTIRERSWGTKGNFSVFSHIHVNLLAWATRGKARQPTRLESHLRGITENQLSLCVKLNSALVLFHYQHFPHSTTLGKTNHSFNYKVKQVTTHIWKNLSNLCSVSLPSAPTLSPVGFCVPRQRY